MPAGLSVLLNDGYTVQIDDNFFNLSFRSKHTVNCAPIQGASYTGSLTVASTTLPVVAFRGDQYAAVHSVVAGSGGSFTFRFVTALNVPNAVLTVYLFDVPNTSGTYGLQTFNAQGQLTFDSSRKYLKIVQNFEFSNYRNFGSQPVVDTNRVYAVMQTQFMGIDIGDIELPGGSDQGYYLVTHDRGLIYINSTRVYINEAMTFNSRSSLGQQQSWYYERLSGQIQVVDVTGL